MAAGGPVNTVRGQVVDELLACGVSQEDAESAVSAALILLGEVVR